MRPQTPSITATALLAAGLFLAIGAKPAYAAVTLNSGFDNMPAQSIVFDKLDVSKATLESNSSAISMKTTSNYNGRKAVVWSITASGSKSLSNPFKITFPNAGFDCDGNRVDLVLSCTSCKAQLYPGSTAAARDQVLIISELAANDPDWNRYIQFTSLPDKGVSTIYGIQMTFDVRVYKTGTASTCSYPLLMNVADLDWYDETSSTGSWSGTYAESIALNSGCGANAFIAKDSLLGHNSSNTRFYGSAEDDSTERSTVAFTINASGGRITWAGSNCATKLFSSKTYEIVSSAGTGGSISPKGTSIVGWRTSKAYSATASTGYKVSKVLVDGARISGTGGKTLEYTFQDIRRDHTISASFAPISYQVDFDGNGASSGSTDPLKSCKYNTGYSMPECGFSRSTHKFTGWNTKADGSGKKYSPGDSFKNLTSTDGGRVTLYAQWENLAIERTVIIRIPEDDFARAQADSGTALVVLARYYDEAEDIGWNIPIDLSECTEEDGFAAVGTNLRATEQAVCTLLDSALFQVSSREDQGTVTIFTLELPGFSLASSSDCVVNHFPISQDNAGNGDGNESGAQDVEGSILQLSEQGARKESPSANPQDTIADQNSRDETNAAESSEAEDGEEEEQDDTAQNRAPSILADGKTVRQAIPEETESIVFDSPGFPPFDTIDLSQSQNGSILGVFDQSTLTFFIFSGQGESILANEDCAGIFEGLDKLSAIDVSKLGTGAVVSLEAAFRGCSSLESIDLSSWDTRALQNAGDLLQGCDALCEIAFGENWAQPEEQDLRAGFPCTMEGNSGSFDAGQEIPSGKGIYRRAEPEKPEGAIGGDTPNESRFAQPSGISGDQIQLQTESNPCDLQAQKHPDPYSEGTADEPTLPESRQSPTARNGLPLQTDQGHPGNESAEDTEP